MITIPATIPHHSHVETNTTHQVLKSQSPDWITPMGELYQNQEDLFKIILIDQQINLDRETKFFHYTYKILNDSDVQQMSTIRESFDPFY